MFNCYMVTQEEVQSIETAIKNFLDLPEPTPVSKKISTKDSRKLYDYHQNQENVNANQLLLTLAKLQFFAAAYVTYSSKDRSFIVHDKKGIIIGRAWIDKTNENKPEFVIMNAHQTPELVLN